MKQNNASKIVEHYDTTSVDTLWCRASAFQGLVLHLSFPIFNHSSYVFPRSWINWTFLSRQIRSGAASAKRSTSPLILHFKLTLQNTQHGRLLHRQDFLKSVQNLFLMFKAMVLNTQHFKLQNREMQGAV